MTSNRRTRCRVRQWSSGAGLLAAAAIIGMGTAHADTPDDVVGQTLAAASTDNQYDPAVFDYSADPSNVFSPVYEIAPTGPEDVEVTDASGDVFGTQDFTISELGFPVDTFSGSVEYSPVPSTAAAMQSSLVGHETLPTGGLATRPETAT